MIAAHRRRTDKLAREKVMIEDNPADFPADSPVAIISLQIDANVVEILKRDADLASAFGDKAQAREIKGDARDHLLDCFEEIILGVKGVGDQAVPGITAKYKMPEPRTEQNLIATAVAWHADTAPPLEPLLVKAGVDKNFRPNLMTTKTAFQDARDDSDTANDRYAEANGALNALVRETMALSRQRSALVKLKYRNNPGKLAAWEIASHLERAPSAKKTEPSV